VKAVRRLSWERIFLFGVDFASIWASTWLTWWLRFRSGLFTEAEPFQLPLPAYLVLSLFWLAIFALRGQYRKLYHISRFRAVQEVLASVLVGLILLFVITLEPGRPALSASRLLLLSYGLVLAAGAGTGRVLFRTLQKQLLERGQGLRATLVVGSGERARQLLEQFRRHPGMGYRVVARVRPPGREEAAGLAAADGGLEDLEALIRERQVVEVVVTEPERELLFEVIQRSTHQGADVLIVPDLYDLVLGNLKAFDIWGMPVIQVFPHLMAPWQFLLKRGLDVGAGLLLGVVGLPLLLLLPPLIHWQSPGAPALFRQRRVGRGGRQFTLLKFRTLHPADHLRQEQLRLAQDGGLDEAPPTAPPPVTVDDPRLTPLGRFLRRYRIDEWPQVWNVLLGQMSLVGPRPEQKELVDAYIRRWPLYARRHNVRPGLTGWAQVRQRYDQSLTRLEDKLSLDLFYLENMSLSLDLRILLYTVRTVLRGAGS
jgi:exopolysaccharide biosynthesis polyprenyl glycosylphosphotransferase